MLTGNIIIARNGTIYMYMYQCVQYTPDWVILYDTHMNEGGVIK